MSTRLLLGPFVCLLLAACGDADSTSPEQSASSPTSTATSATPGGGDSTSATNTPPQGPTRGPSGVIDTTFGEGGIAKGLDDATAPHVVADAQGNLVVIGNLAKTQEAFVARYTPDGKLDPSFDADGISVFAPHEAGVTVLAATSLPLQDGLMLVVGSKVTDLNQYYTCSWLLDPSGHSVPSFGMNGSVCLANDRILAVDAVRLSDGEIVIAAVENAFANTSDLVVARIHADGTPDEAFGTKGATYLARIGQQWLAGITVDSQGRVVVAGHTADSNEPGFVWRLDANGKTDPFFAGGLVTTPIAGAASYTRSIALGPNDSILLTGKADDHAAVVALDASGQLLSDTSGANNLIDNASGPDAADRIAVEGGRVFVVGHSSPTPGGPTTAYSVRIEAGGTHDFVAYPQLVSANALLMTADHAVILGTTEKNGFALIKVSR